MKTLTYLLAIMVALLSVKPGIDLITSSVLGETACCSSSCSSTAADEPSGEEQNCEDNQQCNPFQICSSCILICSAASQDFLTIEMNDVDLNTAYPNHLSANFSREFWQPPQFI